MSSYVPEHDYRPEYVYSPSTRQGPRTFCHAQPSSSLANGHKHGKHDTFPHNIKARVFAGDQALIEDIKAFQAMHAANPDNTINQMFKGERRQDDAAIELSNKLSRLEIENRIKELEARLAVPQEQWNAEAVYQCQARTAECRKVIIMSLSPNI